MSLRRLSLLALAFALAACHDVKQDGAPARIAVAVFDTATSTIPLPNDLALQQQAVGAASNATSAQGELLHAFRDEGGFPFDQEVAATIPIAVRSRQPDGSYGQPTVPADVDAATLTDATLAVARVDGGPRLRKCTNAAGTAPAAPCFEASYASGVLTIRRNGPDGSRRWDAGGRYVVAMRGGANGVRTSDGLAVGADQVIALIAPDKDLSNVENQPPGGIPAALAAQLNGLRSLYDVPRKWGLQTLVPVCKAAGVSTGPCWSPGLDASGVSAAFDVVSSIFPRTELASIQTFVVQPSAAVHPLTDSGSGQLPLPSDFLLDPATGKVRNVAAFGPAAAGLATLDGFSTTAPLFVPLSGAVDAATITKASARIYKLAPGPVQLFDLTDLAFGHAPQIVTQPPTTVTNGQTTTVVLAPAVPVEQGLPGNLQVHVPPLDEKSTYLVVVTNDVKDPAGNKLQRSTLMDLVFSFSKDLCAPTSDLATCTSQVPGISNADAAGLQKLRDELGPVLDALGLRDCSSAATCAVVAYTVTTQDVRGVSKRLAAAPYGFEAPDPAASPPIDAEAIFVPSGTAAFDPQPLFGIPATAFPNAELLETTVPTLYAIEGATGAFFADFATWDRAKAKENLRPVPALVAVPKGAALAAQPDCPGGSGLKCVPLVVFQHAINGARYQLLGAADALAAKGFAVAAIDMPYHGDRALCEQDSDCARTDGSSGVCTPDEGLRTPGDATAPGTCTTGAPRPNPARLSTVASGNFFISGNFFRIRDILRQSQLDVATVALALARPPAGVPQPAAPTDFQTTLAGKGVAIDPSRVYLAGLSLGGMNATTIAATNPRFERAVLNVSGGTLVDVFTQSPDPSFQAALVPVFEALGVDLACVRTGTGCDAATRAAQTARYGQLLAIAKWVIDPADPVNYAARVKTKDYAPELQPLVDGGVASAGTDAYGQLVTGDDVVANAFSRLLFDLTAGGSNDAGSFASTTYDPAASVPVGNRHGLLVTNFDVAGADVQAASDRIRDDAAEFLATLTAAPAHVSVP